MSKIFDLIRRADRELQAREMGPSPTASGSRQAEARRGPNEEAAKFAQARAQAEERARVAAHGNTAAEARREAELEARRITRAAARRKLEATLEAIRPRRILLGAAATLVALAAGIVIYTIARAPQPVAVAAPAAADAQLSLRLDRNIEAFAARLDRAGYRRE